MAFIGDGDDDYDYDLGKGLSVALRLFKRPSDCLSAASQLVKDLCELC
jgi:hypothetical protein